MLNEYRVAAYAKKHLEVGRSFKDKLPKHANKALLLAVEAEYFLSELEEFNFDIFDARFRQKSYVKVPYKIYRVAKKNEY